LIRPFVTTPIFEWVYGRNARKSGELPQGGTVI
jgi:hypothetical protein